MTRQLKPQLIEPIPKDVLKLVTGLEVMGAGFFPFSRSTMVEFAPRLTLEEGLAWIAETNNDDPFLQIDGYSLCFENRGTSKRAALAFVEVETDCEPGDYDCSQACPAPLLQTVPEPVRVTIHGRKATAAAFTDRVTDDVTPVVGFRRPLDLEAGVSWLEKTTNEPAFLLLDGFSLFFDRGSFVRLADGTGRILFANGRPVLRVDKDEVPKKPAPRAPRRRKENTTQAKKQATPASWDVPLMDTIPQAVRDLISGKLVRQVGFGAGPACCCGTTENLDPPRTLDHGLAWVQERRLHFSKAHIEFEDGSRIYFTRHGHYKHVPKLTPV